MLTKSKIRGMVIGGAIGDAAGKPVETWTPEKILEVHPDGINVGKYLPPVGHKWFKEEDHPPGTTTDDTQLGVATMQGFIDGHPEATKTGRFNEYHHAIAAQHVAAYKETTDGWGNTTRYAVRNICNGRSWKSSGKSLDFGGTGNGVPMKVSAFAAWYASPQSMQFSDLYFNQQVVKHAAMTHYTDISAHAALLHVHAVHCCLFSDLSFYKNDNFLDLICTQVWEWGMLENKGSKTYYSTDELRQHPTEEGDSLEDRMLILSDGWYLGTQNEIREKFGNGSCYVLDSLPFAYAYFLRDPYTPQSIIDVIEAGGDTDTNAKMVGELLGALHGIEIFQTTNWKWMCDGLLEYDKLIDLANQFCETFGIKEK